MAGNTKRIRMATAAMPSTMTASAARTQPLSDMAGFG